ncbi:MAG: hypothetical protein D4S01_10780 [Dehalococcoidia bacterium]|nr:MAG: hypothetical protein D4S01_10780 [Dehalococcoidia bacterium]
MSDMLEDIIELTAALKKIKANTADESLLWRVRRLRASVDMVLDSPSNENLVVLDVICKEIESYIEEKQNEN